MKSEVYKAIIADVHNFSGLTRDCAEMLIHKYTNVSTNSIHSILSTEVIQQAKMHRYRLQRHNLWKRYEKAKNTKETGIIVKLAADINLQPTLVARSILGNYPIGIRIGSKGDGNEKGARRTLSNTGVRQLLRNPMIIKDKDLAYEIYLSILYDVQNGYISDALSKAVGYEYEMKLEAYLKERNITFSSENELRIRGYDKTPDVKLEIPIAVDGFIINWIESKARFGSPSVHKTHIKEQYLSYWNRFGTGLVIYWFDYVDDIEQHEKKYIVMNHFPENITYMDPSSNVF